jgi:hypothetical protein
VQGVWIKIQNQDSCVFRQSPPPSFDIYKHNGDDEPEGKADVLFEGIIQKVFVFLIHF